jgi:3-mercaptopyruvate sulfurtransferase SseA
MLLRLIPSTFIAASILEVPGYTKLLNLYGGIDTWQHAGFPVYREQQAQNVMAPSPL